MDNILPVLLQIFSKNKMKQSIIDTVYAALSSVSSSPTGDRSVEADVCPSRVLSFFQHVQIATTDLDYCLVFLEILHTFYHTP